MIQGGLESDIRPLVSRILAILRELGVRAHRRARRETGFVIEGSRGKVSSAVLGSMIPFNGLFGFFTRVRVRIEAARSLNANDPRAFLAIRVWPEDELLDQREQWQATQSTAERIGDSLQCRRVFKALVNRLAKRRVIERRKRTFAQRGQAVDRVSLSAVSVALVCLLLDFVGWLLAIYVPGDWEPDGPPAVIVLPALVVALLGVIAAAVALARCDYRKVRNQASVGAWGNGIFVILFLSWLLLK